MQLYLSVSQFLTMQGQAVRSIWTWSVVGRPVRLSMLAQLRCSEKTEKETLLSPTPFSILRAFSSGIVLISQYPSSNSDEAFFEVSNSCVHFGAIRMQLCLLQKRCNCKKERDFFSSPLFRPNGFFARFLCTLAIFSSRVEVLSTAPLPFYGIWSCRPNLICKFHFHKMENCAI